MKSIKNENEKIKNFNHLKDLVLNENFINIWVDAKEIDKFNKLDYPIFMKDRLAITKRINENLFLSILLL